MSTVLNGFELNLGFFITSSGTPNWVKNIKNYKYKVNNSFLSLLFLLIFWNKNTPV